MRTMCQSLEGADLQTQIQQHRAFRIDGKNKMLQETGDQSGNIPSNLGSDDCIIHIITFFWP